LCRWAPHHTRSRPPAAGAPRLLLVYHKASLVATRDFWKLLLREEVNLVALAHAFRRIDQMEGLAGKTYKWV
jgi:hypothetical protein